MHLQLEFKGTGAVPSQGPSKSSGLFFLTTC